MHQRFQPKSHQFVYRIFLFALDLDELPSLSAETGVFHHNEPGLYTFCDSDHFQMRPGLPASARENAETFLATCGIDEPPGRIVLLTNARTLGYVFNPISIWFCFAKDGRPIGSIAEVGNTFRELKPFFVPFLNGRFHLRAPKHFYVSPFSALDLQFDFCFELPGERLAVHIDDYEGSERILASALTGRRKELSLANLLGFTVKYPLITLKVIGLIHWHAMLLWLKRVPFHRKESRPDLQREVYNPHESLKN